MESGLRTLVVDDSEVDAELMCLALARGGYDVEHERAETAAELRAALARSPWHVVLIDYSLPGFSGPEALKMVRQADPDVPAVVISGSIIEEIASELLRAGANDYVMKRSLGRLPSIVERELASAKQRRALRASELATRQLAAVVQSSEDAIVSLTLDGVVTSWNPAAERLYGWSEHEIVGKHVSRILPPEERDEVSRNIERLRAGQRVSGLETVRVRKDGERIPVSLSMSPIFGPDVTLVGVSKFVRDVRERNRQQLVQAELASVVESSDDMIISTTPEGIIRTWNTGAERALGYSAREMIGRHISVVAPPEGRERQARLLARVLEGETIRGVTIHRVRKDGTPRVFSLTVTPMRDSAGRIVGMSGISRDVTDERRVAAERDALVARLRLYMDRMPVACITTNTEGLIRDWNPAAERIFGFTALEALGTHYLELGIVTLAGMELCNHVRERLLAGDTAAHCSAENRTRDGRTVYCDWFNTLLRREDGTPDGMLAMAIDVTERRQLEEQLLQAQKMEAVGRLAGGVAHDFNNMLVVILGYAEMAAAALEEGDPVRDYVTEMGKAGERAADLTRQLLAFSRRQVLLPRVLDLYELVSGLSKMLRRLIGEDIELVTEGRPDEAWVLADPGHLTQAVVNLAINARDAMPDGGTLTVSTRLFGAGGAEGPCVELSVRDTGVGMDAETLPHIFEPFFTTKEMGSGSGLGLAMVHGTVYQSGGCLDVESEPGHGTVFRVYLPLAGHTDAVAAPDGAAEPPGGSENILVVEDEPMVRALMVGGLRAAGYTVLEADRGEEAAAVVERHGGPLHLVITDVVMPRLSGPDVVRTLLARWPAAKVLFVSGYTDDHVLQRGALQQGVALLQKPFSMQALTTRVRDILDEGRAEQETAVVRVREDRTALPALEPEGLRAGF